MRKMNKMLWALFLFLLPNFAVYAEEISNSKSDGERLPVQYEQGKEQRVITGKIRDDAGVELPGVSVIVPGTTLGVTTDVDGNFSIEVPADVQTLEVSYIGMKDAKIVLSESANYTLKMQPDAVALDEVVAIGYGSTKKSDLSMAVATVELDEVAKSRPSNLSSVMQGTVAGVSALSNGGDPMSNMDILIRGRGSRGDDPVLFIVDGVPNAPYSVEDIETISVLKDAASAAIYGSAVGSGGVVVITTKKAKQGKIHVDINASRGFSEAWQLPETTTSMQYNQVWKDAIVAEPTGNLPSVADAQKYPYGAVTRTDWLDEVFRKGTQEHYAVSISNSGEKVAAIGSLSFDNHQGILLNTFKKNINAKVDVKFDMNKYISLSQRVSYNYNWGQGDVNTKSHEGVLMSAVFFPRSATKYDYFAKDSQHIYENGELMKDEEGKPLYGGTIPRRLAGDVSGYGELRNPVATLERLRQYRPSSKLYATTTLKVEPIKRLIFQSAFTTGLSTRRFENFSPRVPEPGRIEADNRRDIYNKWERNWLWENTLSYERSFGNVHRISALVGFSKDYENRRHNHSYMTGFDKEYPHYTIFENAKKHYKSKELIDEDGSQSIFGRLGYAYANKYFLNASIRRDATARLFSENNSGIFPAVSAAWKVSAEDFFTAFKPYFSFLKLRASWGQVGNRGLVPRYSYVSALERAPWITYLGKDLSTEVQGLFQKTAINRNLTWETTEQTGFGIDFGFWGDKLTGSVDYFDKTTKDLIELMKTSQTSGVDDPYGNVGKVSNKGWEFSARYQDNIGDVNFNIYGNLGTVTNKVLDLGGFDFMSHTNISAGSGISPLRSIVGQPWYSYHVYKTAGIFQSKAEIDGYVYKNTETGEVKKIQEKAKPGDLKYEDTNNDGIIDENDKQYMGSYLPKVSYGAGAGLNFKGIDFSIFFQGVSGVKIFNAFKMQGLTGRSQEHNMLADVMKSWDYDKNSGIPRLSIASDENGNYTKNSDFFLEDGSYLRLKNITVGYTLPRELISRIGMKEANVRLYVSGENIATFTAYSGFDPEVGNHGVDGGRYPISRTWSFGVNINF